MNIYNLAGSPNPMTLGWESYKGVIGKIEVEFLLPWDPVEHENGGIRAHYPDLRGAEVKSFGWGGLPKNGAYLWCAHLFHELKGNDRPLVLEIKFQESRNGFLFKAITPPGRPGCPMTLLANPEGEIVPEIDFKSGSRIAVYFLSGDWQHFGWLNAYPAICLLFHDGVCKKNALAIAAWQAFIERNKF